MDKVQVPIIGALQFHSQPNGCSHKILKIWFAKRLIDHSIKWSKLKFISQCCKELQFLDKMVLIIDDLYFTKRVNYSTFPYQFWLESDEDLQSYD